jgi:hypothetical protein
MSSKWKRLRDCNGGRDTVLAAGNSYVPDLPGLGVDPLGQQGNKAYRERGNFFNAVSRTVGGMSGMIFQKPPRIEKFPKPFEASLKDVTLTNVPFEMFAASAGREIVLVGRYGVLVDAPVIQKEGNRPYLRGYDAENIINWRTTRDAGDEILSMIVLREYVQGPEDPQDEFSTCIIEQYRVLQLKDKRCVSQLWRAREGAGKKEYTRYENEVVLVRRGTPLDFVPFVFLGATAATPDLEAPPLIDLADINLGHWRNSVDHEYGLHLVALPTPWVAGPKTSDGDMPIGPSVVWKLEVNGTAGMLEFSGSGLASLVTAMDEKKKQMAAMGARLLESEPTTSETASAVKMRHSGEHASLRTMAGAIEKGFTLVLQIFAWWAGTEAKPVDTKVECELNKEYLDIKATPDEVRVALTALQAGEISYATWYNILQTGGWAIEGVDAKTERKLIDAEAELKPEIPDNTPPPVVEGDNPPKPGLKQPPTQQ